MTGHLLDKHRCLPCDRGPWSLDILSLKLSRVENSGHCDKASHLPLSKRSLTSLIVSGAGERDVKPSSSSVFKSAAFRNQPGGKSLSFGSSSVTRLAQSLRITRSLYTAHRPSFSIPF